VSENPQSPRDVPGNPDLPPPPAEGAKSEAARAEPSESAAFADAETILPFDQAPLAPPPPSPFGPPPSPFGPPPGPPVPPVPVKKARTGKIIGLILGGLVVLLVICGLSVYFYAKSTYGPRVQNADVGDCLPATIEDPGANISEINKVECGSAEATTKIVGVVENRAIEDLQTDAALCTEFATATSKFWVGEPGKKGKVFCLEPIKR
jgi:hypothetical protein